MSSFLNDFSKEELIQQLESLKEELELSRVFNTNTKNSGDAVLQWRGRERFLAERPVPVNLKIDKNNSFQSDKGDHRIIDGDNLSVMTSLLTEFRGGENKGVDIIYIDPPYNTGEDVFSYNDNYNLTKSEIKTLRSQVGRAEELVGLDDPSRHTKWINHMAPRLWAARKLLKTTGVVIVSIDEHELPRLWMLMEEIFGPSNRIATLIWSRSRKNDANYISEGHEYLLVWSRSKEMLDTRRRQLAQTPQWESDKGRWRKRKEGADVILEAYELAKAEYGEDIEKIQTSLDNFFKLLPKDHPAKKIRFKKVDHKGVYNDDGNLSWPGGGGPRYDIIHPLTKKACKVPTRGWAFQEEEMLKLIAGNRIAFKKTHQGIPRLITYLVDMETEVQTSIISRTGQRAVQTVDGILGKKIFKNPKDHEMLAEIFNLVTWRQKDTVILDPYAGSGTTGHAVISMNAEDDGNRCFILIENGDPRKNAKIARKKYTQNLTAERIKRVINGDWFDKKEHPKYNTGYTFYRSNGDITKKEIMASTRESLADLILQIVEDDSNRIDCRVEGRKYVIGKTKLGYGIALIWEPIEGIQKEQILTWEILDDVLNEADAANVMQPIHIYATASTAPVDNELYKFHQIPNAILAKLGILDNEEDL